MDKMFLQGLKFIACHGVGATEKVIPQLFEIDIVLHLDLKKPGISDDLADTVDYGAIFQEVRTIVEGPSFNLIEAMAEAIAKKVLSHKQVQLAEVTVRKPNPPLAGDYDYFAVSILRGAS